MSEEKKLPNVRMVAETKDGHLHFELHGDDVNIVIGAQSSYIKRLVKALQDDIPSILPLLAPLLSHGLNSWPQGEVAVTLWTQIGIYVPNLALLPEDKVPEPHAIKQALASVLDGMTLSNAASFYVEGGLTGGILAEGETLATTIRNCLLDVFNLNFDVEIGTDEDTLPHDELLGAFTIAELRTVDPVPQGDLDS